MNKFKKVTLPFLAKVIMIRIQVLCVSVGGLILIMHFNLIEQSIGYMPLGMIAILVTMAMLVPIPHWWELEAGPQRERWYGDEFKEDWME